MALGEEWAKSTHSAGQGECVEARRRNDVGEATADVRDSRHPDAGQLTFAGQEWTALLGVITP